MRTTGASMVEDAERTNSPISCSFATASFEVIPSSLASSCTRTLATFLLSEGPRSLLESQSTNRLLLSCPASKWMPQALRRITDVFIVRRSSLGTHRVSIRFLTRFQVGRS
ncbi:hypothetical protein JOF47_000658 [Paeniglutamicibacter kerguelensis]|uniref:Uncharacterized protein n=1 Tax=Paeniglutamicibacter kerguelensis TaxID=254788 RepID=A0ABS4X9L1_9MICC|nr:hypothetical protein [Paeniglutamicibacter kerguelensis]